MASDPIEPEEDEVIPDAVVRHANHVAQRMARMGAESELRSVARAGEELSRVAGGLASNNVEVSHKFRITYRNTLFMGISYQSTLLRAIEDFKSRIAPMFAEAARDRDARTEMDAQLRDARKEVRDLKKRIKGMKEAEAGQLDLQVVLAETAEAAERLEQRCARLHHERNSAVEGAKRWQEKAQGLERQNQLLQEQASDAKLRAKREEEAKWAALKEKDQEIASLKVTLVRHKKIVRIAFFFIRLLLMHVTERGIQAEGQGCERGT